MSTKGNERERDDDQALLWSIGGLAIGAAALVKVPGYVAGAAVGMAVSALAVALLGREGMDLRAWKVRGLTVAGFGLLLLTAYLLLADDLGWAGQIASFERRWEYPIDWTTAARFPAAWLPQAMAVAAIISGSTTAWVSRAR